MSNVKEVAERVRGELEQRGARAIHVGGDLNVEAFVGGPTGSEDQAVSVEFDGEREMLENAVSEVAEAVLRRVQAEAWPGGDVHVTGSIGVLDGGSPGVNPGGDVDISASSAPEPEETDWHAAPGDLVAVPDPSGIMDARPVEVWPVRVWEARPRVQGVTALRYVPHPSARGLDWWAGYARLVPDRATPCQASILAERIEREPIDHESVFLTVSYGPDDAGWVGWSETDLPADSQDMARLRQHVDHHLGREAKLTTRAAYQKTVQKLQEKGEWKEAWHGIPVVSTVPEDSLHQLDHQEAAALTEALATACLKLRREVLP